MLRSIMILQPKRWQTADDPRYDPIRHRPWFARLLKRKKAIPMMECAFNQWRAGGFTQSQVCKNWEIDPRDFRDYFHFHMGIGDKISPLFLSVLTSAYNAYREHSAIRPIHSFIADLAPVYGVKARPIQEEWEINPFFYPSDYAYPTN